MSINFINIFTHNHCDFDGFASMVAISNLFKLIDPKIKPRLIINSTFEENIENFLHAFDEDFAYRFLNDQEIGNFPIVLVDSTDLNFIENYDFEPSQIYVYDHHDNKMSTPDVEYHYKKAGACVSFILDQFMEQFPEHADKFSYKEALLFLLGIYDDTGSLTFPVTTDLDRKIAKFLIQTYKIKESDIKEFLVIPLTPSQKFFYYSMVDAHIRYRLGDVKVDFVPLDLKFDLGSFVPVVNEYQRKQASHISFFILKRKNKTYIMGRSKVYEFSVLKTLESQIFDGGGHKTAAGAAVYREKLEDTLKNLKSMFFNEYLFSKPMIKFFKHGELKYHKKCKKIQISKDFTWDDLFALNLNWKIDSCYSIYYNEKLMRTLKYEDFLRLVDMKNDLIDFRYKLFAIKSSSFENTKYVILSKIFNICKANNIKIYAVGGPVRDMMLTASSGEFTKDEFFSKLGALSGNDLDLCVFSREANNDALFVGKHLEDLTNVRFNPDFKTININVNDSFFIDIATMRSEIYERSGALPKVFQGDMISDLGRRDLTINAMAMSLNNEDFGVVFDYYGGISDLKQKIARLLHDKSLLDDPTRIFRIVRFAARFDLTFDANTEKLLKEALEKEVYKNISNDRLLNEFKKIFKEKNSVVVKILELLEKFGLLQKVLHKDIRVDYFRIKANKIDDWFSYLLILVSNFNKEQIDEFMKKFNFTRQEKRLLRNQDTI